MSTCTAHLALHQSQVVQTGIYQTIKIFTKHKDPPFSVFRIKGASAGALSVSANAAHLALHQGQVVHTGVNQPFKICTEHQRFLLSGCHPSNKGRLSRDSALLQTPLYRKQKRELQRLLLYARTAHLTLHLGQVSETRVYETIKKLTEHFLSLLSRLYPWLMVLPAAPKAGPAAVQPLQGDRVPCPAYDDILPQSTKEVQW